MNTTNVENNPGPASIIIVSGEKDLEVACSMIMGKGDVLKNPLNITEAKVHTCKFDEKKKIAKREYDGKEEDADFEIMKEERDTRFEQGKQLSESELAKQGIHIGEDGTITRETAEMDR